MENNKAYLQKIQWVFLIAVIQLIATYFAQPWLFDSPKRYIDDSMINYLAISAFLYAALGMATSKWKEAGIAFAVYIVIFLADHFISRSLQKEVTGLLAPQQFNVPLNIVFMLLYPLSLLTFIGLITGWTKRLLLVYAALVLQSMSQVMDFYPATYIRPFIGFWSYEEQRIPILVLTIIMRLAIFIFHILFLCEMVNYAKGKIYPKKLTLLNLGNDYSKLNSIITFWAVKTSISAIVIGAAGFMIGMLLAIYVDGFRDIFSDGLSDFYRLTGWLYLLSFAGIALFAVWYFRKFLIETFASYGIHSRFLYSLCLVPVIGFFVFLVLQAKSIKNKSYSEKVNSLGLFAGSSTAAAGIFMLVMAILLLMQLTIPDLTFMISVAVNIGLFFWLIKSKTGYLVSLWIVGAVLLLIILATFTITSDHDMGPNNTLNTLSILFALLIFNLIQLVFIYPVYHFEEFQYMPAEDPDAKASRDPEYSLFS